MIYAGIDVAKDNHSCFTTNSDSKVLFQVFTLQNNWHGFETLFSGVKPFPKICPI